MYSAYKLNKQGDNTQPCHTCVPISNQSVVPCPVLLLLDVDTGFSGDRKDDLLFASLKGFPLAQLVKNHLQCERPGFDPWVGKIPWRRERLHTPVFWPGEFHGLYSPWGHKESDMTEQLSLSLSKIFSQFVVIHTVNGFIIGHEAEVDVFLEFLCFLCDPMNVGNLISGSSAFSKSSLSTWKFSVHILPEPSLKDFEYNLTSMWNECNCMIVWTFFDTSLLWDWNENRLFPVLWPLLSFPNLLIYWVQHFHSIVF